MVILNQTRDSIYVLENLERVYISKDYDIRCYTCTGCNHTLAKYDDEEAVRKSFNDFNRAVNQNWAYFNFPPRMKVNAYEDRWNETEYKQKVGAYR